MRSMLWPSEVCGSSGLRSRRAELLLKQMPVIWSGSGTRSPVTGSKGVSLFHTGRHRFQLDRGIEAVPIAGLWGPSLPESEQQSLL